MPSRPKIALREGKGEREEGKERKPAGLPPGRPRSRAFKGPERREKKKKKTHDVRRPAAPAGAPNPGQRGEGKAKRGRSRVFEAAQHPARGDRARPHRDEEKKRGEGRENAAASPADGLSPPTTTVNTEIKKKNPLAPGDVLVVTRSATLPAGAGGRRPRCRPATLV